MATFDYKENPRFCRVTQNEAETTGRRVWIVTVTGSTSTGADDLVREILYDARLSAASPCYFYRAWEPVALADTFNPLYYPFSVMYPKAYDVEILSQTKARLEVFWSSMSENRPRAWFAGGSIVLETKTAADGSALPEMAQFHFPTLEFHVEQTFAWDQAFGNAKTRYASATGTELERILYCLGRTNSLVWLKSFNTGEWLFQNAEVIESSSGMARFRFDFAHTNFKAGSEKVRWKWRSKNGTLYDLREQAPFSCLRLQWSDGTLIQ